MVDGEQSSSAESGTSVEMEEVRIYLKVGHAMACGSHKNTFCSSATDRCQREMEEPGPGGARSAFVDFADC